ncbi:MAG: hypothetical protein VR72_08465 [Clostridiaceae bacterium BRH_c20a]|nr:MAG: hypothetical protein VR72_08465 [Clostridiaceae bacterium BRH_c20a]
MKFLCTGDLHIGFRRKLDPEKTIKYFSGIFEDIYTLVCVEDIDALIFTGDIFDDNEVDSRLFQILVNFINKIRKVKIFIAPGNHDPYTSDSPYQNYEWPENVHVFKGWESIEVSDCIIHGYGYLEKAPDIDALLQLDRTKFNTQKTNIVVIHGIVKELQTKEKDKRPALEFSTNDIINIGADLVLLGHIHNPRTLYQTDKILAAYSGEPINRYQRELVSRGVIVGEISGKMIDLKLRSLKCPQEYKIFSRRGRDYSKQQESYEPVYHNELKWDMLRN